MTDRRDAKREDDALAELDATLAQIGGCSDGGCLIIKPVGMHTNGGCSCLRNWQTAQRYAHAHNKFANAIRVRPPKKGHQ